MFEGEPHIDPGFRELDNVALLPHIGSATLETRVAMGERVLANIAAFFAGDEPEDRRCLIWWFGRGEGTVGD